jgi:hypothetical protein
MAKIAVPDTYFPSVISRGSPGSTNARIVVAMNGSGDRLAMVFQSPRTGTIDSIGFATGTVITSQSLDVRLETVGTNGHPTGTLATAGATGAEATPASNTMYDVSLGTGHAASAGDRLAAVVQFTSTVGSLQLVSSVCDNLISGHLFPYIDFNGSGSYAMDDVVPALSVRIGGVCYHVGSYPGIDLFRTSFTSASTPDERGNRFVLPVPMWTRGIGARFEQGGPFGTSHAVRLRLYDAADTVIFERTFDDTASINSGGIHVVYGAETLLDSGVVYRVALEHLSTVGCYIDELTAGSNDILGHWPGGTAWYYTSRSDAGSWTDDDTKRAHDFFLVVSGIEGNLLTHPGMAGGMRG